MQKLFFTPLHCLQIGGCGGKRGQKELDPSSLIMNQSIHSGREKKNRKQTLRFRVYGPNSVFSVGFSYCCLVYVLLQGPSVTSLWALLSIVMVAYFDN